MASDNNSFLFVSDDIFEQLRDNTLVVIPVDGAFEHRLRHDTDFPEGINPRSLHGQLIERLGGEVSFKEKVDNALRKSNLRTAEKKIFSKSAHDYYAYGSHLILREGNVCYFLFVWSWLNEAGEAHLSTHTSSESLIFEDMLDKIIKSLESCYKDKEIRIPLLGTGILRSKKANSHPSYLIKTLYKKIKNSNLENCRIWVEKENFNKYNLEEYE